MNRYKKLGVIGAGNRGCMILSNMLKVADGSVKCTCICEKYSDYSQEFLKVNQIDTDGIRFYTNPDEMLEKEALDGVVVATRCSLHTDLALKVIDKGLPLFLEKPIATTLADYHRLKEAGKRAVKPIVVSFPLRLTEPVRVVKEIIDSGKLGRIEHVQAYNNVPYGGVYYHSWYRDENETQGLWLQKATHDFDYITYILGHQPVELCAMNSKQIFKGDKPAGLRCADCAEKDTCPEGPYVMEHIKHDDPRGDMCCFAVDTGNEDSGSAIIRYDTGMHAVYSQNFFARKKAGKRGARFIGYDGTIEFDWNTDEIKIFMHDGSPDEVINLDTARLAHGGGDDRLCLNFIDIMDGQIESKSPLEAGLLSVLMCLKAKKSSNDHTFESLTEE